MSLNYKVILRRPATKFLAKQDKSIQRRIIQALTGLEKVPPDGDIRPMKGNPGQYRLRIGTYRAIYEVNQTEKMVYVKVIGNRGDIY